MQPLALVLLPILAIPAQTESTNSNSVVIHGPVHIAHEVARVSCGVGAAYLLTQRIGCPLTIEEIEAALPVAAEAPMSFMDLQLMFENLGFKAEGLWMPLVKLDRPVIAFQPHPKGAVGHFVVVEPIRNEGSTGSSSHPSTPSAPHFLVLDPLDQPVMVPGDRLAKAWDGRVLVVFPNKTNGTRPHTAALRAFISWPIVLGVACAGIGSIVVLCVLGGARRLGNTLRSLCKATFYQLSIRMPFNAVKWRFSSRRWVRPISCGAAVVLCAAVAIELIRLRSSQGRNLSSDTFGSELETPAEISMPEWGTVMRLEDGAEHDFGEVQLGEPLQHTLLVKNIGASDLLLAKLKMNCACNAQVEYERDLCRPGETARITISTKAVGYGRQRKPIPFAINRDGSVLTLFTLKLHYRVAWLEQAQFVPNRVEFGEISSNALAVDRDVELVLIGPPDGPEPELTQLESDSAAVRAVVLERVRLVPNARTARTIPANRFRLVIRLTVDPLQLRLGRFHGHVTAQTSSGPVKLHVMGAVCHPIVASPASLVVEKSRTQVTRRIVQLRQLRDNLGAVILSATATTPGVSCVTDSEHNRVRVTVEPDADVSGAAGIDILTQIGEARETLHVPLVEL